MFNQQSAAFGDYSGSKRTSTTWYLPYKEVPELLALATEITGLPPENFEEPQIVRYEIGQQFTWHYDAIPPTLNKNGGNRLATLLVYLNTLTSSAGGATSFKDLNLMVRPEIGKALLFFPCFADGASDERTMHCGQMCSETKWVAQIWIHQSAYTPVSVN
jgi:prolyl 4-hydroxylase